MCRAIVVTSNDLPSREVGEHASRGLVPSAHEATALTAWTHQLTSRATAKTEEMLEAYRTEYSDVHHAMLSGDIA